MRIECPASEPVAENEGTLTVVGTLDSASSIGVYTAKTPEEYDTLAAPVAAAGYDCSACFFSDRAPSGGVISWDGSAVVLQHVPFVRIVGISGSFNDKIKMNYYFDIPEDVRADEGAYVNLTNGSTGETLTLLVREAQLADDKGGYKFSIPLAAKEAGDDITARVYDGQDSVIAICGNNRDTDYTETGVQYSLMKYFDWLEYNGEGSEQAMGRAARDYCTAAMIYFNYNAEGLTVSSAVDAVTADTLSGYVAGREGTLPTGVTVRGISAMLESDNTVRIYLGFRGVDPSSLTYAIDGNPAELHRRSDGKCYLAMDAGVWSNRLQDVHTYSVSDGENTYTISASVLTYARSCVIKTNEKEINLGKTLYLYNNAAIEAFGE